MSSTYSECVCVIDFFSLSQSSLQDSIIAQLRAYCGTLQHQMEDLRDDLRTTQQKCDAEVYVVREEKEAENLENDVMVSF